MKSMVNKSFAIALAMLLTIAAAWALTPRQDRVAPGEVKFAEIIPESFGDWTMIPNPLAQVDLAVKRDERDQASLLYDEVLTRSYRNGNGEVVMLAIAYGRQMRQELKIHRPELCYAAQGFRVSGLRAVDAGGWGEARPIAAQQMLAVAPNRSEAVMYWIRIGDEISKSAMQTRLGILREGLAGNVPDGVLVRTSQVVGGADAVDESIGAQKAFVGALIRAVSPPDVVRFIDS